MREIADAARIHAFLRALGEAPLTADCRVYPELPGWETRSIFIARHGRVSFYHYDLYSQALAKLERAEEKDLADVREMLARGLIERRRAWELFRAIAPLLYRYPAIDPREFEASVAAALGPEPPPAC